LRDAATGRTETWKRATEGFFHGERIPQQVQPMASRDINVMALVKGGERYVFLYDDESRAEALRTLARYAADPDLSFSWYDAAMLSHKVRGAGAQPRRHRFMPRADRQA
jgi:hypothetical protein